MKKVNFNILFDRCSRASSQKAASIEVKFSYGSERKFLSTGIKVFSGQWSTTNKKIIKRPDANLLNEQLNAFVKRCTEIVAHMTEKGISDLSVIPSLFFCDGSKDDFIAYCENRTAERKVVEHTRERYRVFCRFLRTWGEIKTFSDVNVAKVRRMDEYLHRKGLSQATIYNYHKYLKLFANDALIDGRLEQNPYQYLPFHIARGEKQYVDYCTQEQYEAIRDLEISSAHIAKARDLFLFQCYTGLAYSDLMAFDKGNCETSNNGKIFYHSQRTKTETDFVFQLLPPAVAILKKYDYKLPTMSNQKYNDYLKVVGAMAGVEKLHSHMGRATAATLFLSKGMPMNIVAKILGHTTMRQTVRYARTLDKDVRSAFDELEDKF